MRIFLATILITLSTAGGALIGHLGSQCEGGG
jgi:hypothetical protein